MRNLISSWYHGARPPAETSCITATHNFEVRNHQLLDGLGVGKYVRSSTFSAGGHDWNIRLYPDGYDQDCAGYPSAYLHRLNGDPAKDVIAKFTLDILEKNQDTDNAAGLGVHEHTFTPASEQTGFREFVERSVLKSLRDFFTIRCVLTVVLESRTERKRDLTVVPLPPPELPGNLERALKAGRGTDVTFDVRGRVFPAHRFMLATQSTVFDAQLFGPEQEQDTRRVEFVDMEPAIFEMLLRFVYTDSLPSCDEKGHNVAAMQQLLVAADLYRLDRLKVMCEKKLYKSIDANTVTSTLAIADWHDCHRLKDACLEFMSLPGVTKAVMASDGFNQIMGRCPPVALKERLEEE